MLEACSKVLMLLCIVLVTCIRNLTLNYAFDFQVSEKGFKSDTSKHGKLKVR